MRYYIAFDVIRKVQQQEYDIIKKLKNLKSSFIMNDSVYTNFREDLESKLRLIKFSLSKVTNEGETFYTNTHQVYTYLYYMYQYNNDYMKNIS